MTLEQKEKLLSFARDLAVEVNAKRRESVMLKDWDEVTAEDANDWAEVFLSFLKEIQNIFPQILDVYEHKSEEKGYSIVFVGGGEEAYGL